MFALKNTLTNQWIHSTYNLTLDNIIGNLLSNKYEDIQNIRLQTRFPGAIILPTLYEIKEYFTFDEPTEVPVEEYHIENGEPGNANSCPLALAIEDNFPHSYPGVSGDIHFNYSDDDQDNEHLTYKLSHSVCKFINDFDRDQYVEPGTLIIGTKYAWYKKQGDINPYEAMVKEIETEESKMAEEKTN